MDTTAYLMNSATNGFTLSACGITFVGFIFVIQLMVKGFPVLIRTPLDLMAISNVEIRRSKWITTYFAILCVMAWELTLSSIFLDLVINDLNLAHILMLGICSVTIFGEMMLTLNRLQILRRIPTPNQFFENNGGR